MREPIEDDPLSDRGEGNGDQDMPDANERKAIVILQALDRCPCPMRHQRGTAG